MKSLLLFVLFLLLYYFNTYSLYGIVSALADHVLAVNCVVFRFSRRKKKKLFLSHDRTNVRFTNISHTSVLGRR